MTFSSEVGTASNYAQKIAKLRLAPLTVIAVPNPVWLRVKGNSLLRVLRTAIYPGSVQGCCET